MKRFAVSCAAFALLAFSQSVRAEEPECYDAKVLAKPIGQIPTMFPNEPGYIVISWPWFVDLRVKRVIDGDLEAKEITALAVLHSGYVRKYRTFLLRRNSLNGFNILRPEQPGTVQKCQTGITPMQSYLRPADGEALEDYRRAGEEELKRDLADEEDE